MLLEAAVFELIQVLGAKQIPAVSTP